MNELMDLSSWVTPSNLIGIVAAIAAIAAVVYARRADRALERQRIPIVSTIAVGDPIDGWQPCEMLLRNPTEVGLQVTTVRSVKPRGIMLAPNVDAMLPRPASGAASRVLRPLGWEVGARQAEFHRTFFFRPLPKRFFRPDPRRVIFRMNGVRRDADNSRFMVTSRTRTPE